LAEVLLIRPTRADKPGMLIGSRAFRRLFGVQSGVRAQLHICERCAGDFVEAIRWDPVVRGTRHVELCCTDCAHVRVVLADLTAAALFTAAQENRLARLTQTAEQLTRERMAAWVDSFTVALERDLIDATHF
jgi:hypothetical protein